jgi:uncharacterized protein
MIGANFKKGLSTMSTALFMLIDSGVNDQFKEFEEGHLSVLPPLINRALRFVSKGNERVIE